MTHSNRPFRHTSLVSLALLGWFLAGAVLPQEDKGVQSLLIRDRQGREVGWYDGSYALLIGVSDYTAGWPDLESVPGELAAPTVRARRRNTARSAIRTSTKAISFSACRGGRRHR